MNRKFLKLNMSNDHKVKAAREFVDKFTNGEDILMSFVVPSGYQPPLAIPYRSHASRGIHDPAGRKGLSGNKDHPKERKKCVKFFNGQLGWPLIENHSTLLDNPLP